MNSGDKRSPEGKGFMASTRLTIESLEVSVEGTSGSFPKKRARRKICAATPTEAQECHVFLDWARIVTYTGEPLIDRVVKIPNERGKSGPR